MVKLALSCLCIGLTKSLNEFIKTDPKDINKIRSICLLKNKDIKFYRTENGGSNFVLKEFWVKYHFRKIQNQPHRIQI